jgi:predicted aspartyl protease
VNATAVLRLLPGASLLLWLGIEAPAQSSPPATNPAVAPLRVQRGKATVSARVNGSEPLSLQLDTGFTVTTLHPEVAEQLQLRPAGRVTITGIAGEERAPMLAGAGFDIGGALYEPRRVAALPSERERNPRRDGVLGAGLFRRFVVEMDFKSGELRLHEPKQFTYAGKGEILPLRWRKEIPVVSADLLSSNGPAVTGDFEIDTGCDSGLCLGQLFIERHRLLDETRTRGGGKVGVGGAARTRTGHIFGVQLGQIRLNKVQADFFLEGSPVDDDLAGHIGLDALRAFNVIFDYSRHRMILER